MKKSYKILIAVVLFVVLLVAAVALGISPAAKWYVEKHSKELIGRTVTMDRLSINIFSGRMRLEGLRMLEADDSTTFISLDRYEMQMRLLPLLGRSVEVRSIALTHPDVRVFQDGRHFNFDDLLLRFLTDSTAAPTEPSKPWRVGIDDITLDKGHFYYQDMQLNAVWGFNDLSLRIPGIYFKDKTDVGILFDFATGGTLRVDMNYNMDTADYDLKLALGNMTLEKCLPYLQQALNVGGVEGLLSANLHLNGNIGELMKMYTDGQINLAQFALHDHNTKELLHVDSLCIDLERGSLRNNQFHFRKIFLDGMRTSVEIAKNGSINLLSLLKTSDERQDKILEAQPETLTQTAVEGGGDAPLDVRFADIEISRGVIHFRDNSVEKPFNYRISNIHMRSRDFAFNKRNNLIVDARMQQTGVAKLRWEGMLDDLNNQNITLILSNINLSEFTPYCEHYTAYPLTHGNLSFRSQNIIRNRYLDGTNHLDMFEPKVDKKNKELKPEFKIPLKLGLYILKDKKGHVKIDLPVKGSLESPEFSYRKIVMKALGNVLVKIVTAPFSFLSGNKENLEYINIEPLQYTFNSEQYASLDHIAQVLKDKPELKMALTQRINYRKAWLMQAENDLKIDYYKHMQQGIDSAVTAQLSMIDYEKILAMDFKSESIRSFADSLLMQRGMSSNGLNDGERALKLYGEQAQTQLQQLMSARDKALHDYMTTMQGVPVSSLRMAPMEAVALQAYEGKDRYTIGMEVEGETVDVPTDADQAATNAAQSGLVAKKEK